MRVWVPMPTRWIRSKGLRRSPWKREGRGSDNIAALMALIAIAHAVDDVTGIAGSPIRNWSTEQDYRGQS
jgi:hypothetical protein